MPAAGNRVLVTGAGGYLGSVLVGQLLVAGHDVVVLDRFFFGDRTLDAWRGHRLLEIVHGDVRTADLAILDGIDAVVDLAALSNDPSGEMDQALTRAINHEARVRLATAAQNGGVARYILASSCSVYGTGGTTGLDETASLRPLTTYALCNALAERDLLSLSNPAFAVTAIRNATLFGASPRMRFDLAINLMTLDAVDSGTITVLGGGQQVRPFLHVADAARCVGAVLAAPLNVVEGQIFNAGLANHTITEVAQMVARRLPTPVDVAVVADDIDHRNYDVSFDKMRKTLGFHPQTTVADGIDEVFLGLRNGTLVDDPTTRTVAWYRSLMARGILDTPHNSMTPSSDAFAGHGDGEVRIALCAVGRKGLRVLRQIVPQHRPEVVVAYPQDRDADRSFADMAELCAGAGIAFVEDRHVSDAAIANVDLVFLVGWQYLLAQVDERVVVFHDSLLPRYRGSAPTVTALINGEPELGVTALRPVAAVDAGPILGQRRWQVSYPMQIAEALDRQAACIAELLLDLVAAHQTGGLHARPQEEAQATYSLWRDGDDGWIDWTWDAARISRFVDAVGFPYDGARTVYDGVELTVDRVEIADDLRFEDRVPGKIWSLTPDGPLVVCGTGMVRIREARDATGAPAAFPRRRRRLGTGAPVRTAVELGA